VPQGVSQIEPEVYRSQNPPALNGGNQQDGENSVDKMVREAGFENFPQFLASG
jgi:hypothetical protein